MWTVVLVCVLLTAFRCAQSISGSIEWIPSIRPTGKIHDVSNESLTVHLIPKGLCVVVKGRL